MAGSISIIGAGIAGLSAGCYALMNGYRVRIYEAHALPGGLCTAWRRQGYLADGCIEWLCGSGPEMSINGMWQELGAMEDLTYYQHRAQIHLELPDLNFTLYTNADEMEAYLLAMAPEDADFIHELAQDIRDFRRYSDPGSPEAASPEAAQYMGRLMTTTLGDMVSRIKNPKLCQAFSMLWGGPVPEFYGLLCLGYAHNQSAGVPLGGSLAFSRAIEHRFLELGGEIHYNAQVKKIIVEDDRAVGLELADRTTVWEREGDIISAADAHLTIFEMLDGRYVDDKIRAWFENVPVIQSPVMVTLGVGMAMDDAPISIGGILFAPAVPVSLYGQNMSLISAHVLNYDPTTAPQGKTAIKVGLPGNYDYWKKLHETPAEYEAEKDRIAKAVIAALDARFPGLAEHVEMVDVATTLTFERYTANWQGSSQGWMPTPQSQGWMQEAAQTEHWPASKMLPGLGHFYMAGHWTDTFGGVPMAGLSGRGLIERLCQRDGLTFTTTKP